MPRYIKQAISIASRYAAFEKFIDRVERFDGKHQNLLRVLTYHRVDELESRPWMDPGLISASPQTFDKQIRFLSNHYQIIPITDVITVMESRDSKKLPSRAVLLTFDDAYSDFEEHAWPILKRYGVPATLFVPTAYPDKPERTFWWNDLYQAIQNTPKKDYLDTRIGHFSLLNKSRTQTFIQLKSHIKTLKHLEAVSLVKQICDELGVQPKTNNILSWDSLRKLTKEGLSLGAHTRTHPLINRVPLEEAREEVTGSLYDLKRETGSALPVFAYPSGEFNDKLVRLLEIEGFVLAFTTARGINNIDHTNPLRLRRINVGGSATLPTLRAQLLSWMVHLNWLQTS